MQLLTLQNKQTLQGFKYAQGMKLSDVPAEALPFVKDMPGPMSVADGHLYLHNGTRLQPGDWVCLDGKRGAFVASDAFIQQEFNVVNTGAAMQDPGGDASEGKDENLSEEGTVLSESDNTEGRL